MRRRNVVIMLMILLLSPLLGGCWDRSELEEQAFVLAIGVDKGRESVYSVTAAIALPAKLAGGDKGGGGGGGGEKDKPYMLTTVEAPTVAGAMAMISAYVDRRVSLLHTKALFMGEELARISGMYTMDEFVRFRQVRRSTFYIVTRGKAADFLKGMDPKMEKDPQRFIEQLTYNVRNTGMLPAASQIHQFVTTVDTGYSEPVTYYAALREEDKGKSGNESSQAESGFKSGEIPRTGGPNIEMVGGTVFRGEKMAGILTGDEMRLILMLQDRFSEGYFSIPDPKRERIFVSVLLRRARPFEMKVDLSGAKPLLQGMIRLEGDLVATQSGVNYTEPELQSLLESHIARQLEGRVADLLQKTQDWGADAAGFGRYMVRKFPTVGDWEAYRWKDRYKDATVRVNVQVALRRFGLRLEPPEVRK